MSIIGTLLEQLPALDEATYMVATQQTVKRGKVHRDDGDTKPELAYVPQDEYGRHRKNIDAKRAYLTVLEPDLKGTSDDFIRLHWRSVQNTGHAKIVKV